MTRAAGPFSYLPGPGLLTALVGAVAVGCVTTTAWAQQIAQPVVPSFNENQNCAGGAAPPCPVPITIPYYGGKALGYCEVTAGLLTASVTLTTGCTASFTNGIPTENVGPGTIAASKALICARGNGVFWRDDGVTVSANVGQSSIAVSGSCMWYTMQPLSALQFSSSVASSILDVTFYSR